MLDVNKFVGDLHDYISRAVSPIETRLRAVESRPVEKGVPGERGEKGLDGAVGPQGERGIDGATGIAGERGPAGERGDRGQDAEPIDIKEVVAELLQTEGLKALVDLHVAEAVAKHFEDNPVRHGVDGKDGRNGEKGEPGAMGGRGEKGDAGIDGVGLAGAMIDRDDTLIITTTKGETIRLGQVVGKDGSSGKDGIDGLGFDDMDVEFDGERSFVFKWKRGPVERTKTISVPTVIDRGYWREGTQAKAGDGWTNDGSWWIAKRDNNVRPTHDAKDDWRLGARKGDPGHVERAERAPSGPVSLRKE